MSNVLTSNVAMKDLRIGFKLNEMQGALNEIDHIRMKAIKFDIPKDKVKEFIKRKDERVDSLIARYENLKEMVVKDLRTIYAERFGEENSLGANFDIGDSAEEYYVYETGFINHVTRGDDIYVDFTGCRNFLDLNEALETFGATETANSYLMRFRIRNVSGLYLIEGDIWDNSLNEFDFSYYLFTV